MKYISLLLKPASSKCQLRCKYCFYFDETTCRDIPDYGFMSQQTIQTIIQKILHCFKEETTINLLFQGGEPTLVGLTWYEKVIAYIEAHKESYHHFHFSIQTNGMLIDENWISLFKKHHFLVGLSLDGYQANHDFYRLDTKYHPTFKRVLDSYHALKQNKIDVNILTVLTEQLSQNPIQFYHFIQKEDIRWLQLIPCLPSLNINDPYALTPQSYASFMIEVFHQLQLEWKQNIYRSINIIDDILSVFQKRMPMQCGKLGFCTRQFVIEADGSVFPCDFYCLDRWKLGNIVTDSFEEIADIQKAKQFITKQKMNHSYCQSCRYKNICNGGCPRQAPTYLQDRYCGQQQVFQHIEKWGNQILMGNYQSLKGSTHGDHLWGVPLK